MVKNEVVEIPLSWRKTGFIHNFTPFFIGDDIF